MKKKLFLIPALALLLASCSSDEPIVNELQNPEYAAANSYLNINLRNANGSTQKRSRANEYTPNDEDDFGTYEDGTGMESLITQVRFYFFDDGENGAPFPVRQDIVNDLYDNFIDWFPNSTEFGGPNHTETVEQTLNATLGITLKNEQQKPAQVVAIANPTKELLAYQSQNTDNQNTDNKMSPASMSLQQLKGVVNNYMPANNETPFVMSNSVYVDAAGKAVYATALVDKNFQTTPSEAAKPENVVKIYIERVLARVDFGIKMTPATIQGVQGVFYKLGEFNLNDGADGTNAKLEEPIYVKLLGWNVTSTTGTSNLIKHINASWGENEILGEDNPWYISQLHRSFWAINPDKVSINFGNFGKVGDDFTSVTPEGQYANSLTIPTQQDEYITTYLQENANPFSQTAEDPEDPSKVIIAAQLVGQDGKPLTICQYQNVNYTLEGLQNQLAKQLGSLYYETTVGNQTGWAQIKPDMLTFTTTDPAGNLEGDKEYHVYAVLTNDAEDYTWAYSNDGTTFTPFEDPEDPEESVTDLVNKYIRSKLTSILIWNSGLTYYYFNIKHLGNADTNIGYLGVVRNHIYRTTVTSIKGFGTPVYNPGLVIHPEQTESDETVIQFVIEPLSWRLVSNDYELNWE